MILFFSLSSIHAHWVLFTLDDFAEDASGCHGVECENGFFGGLQVRRHGGVFGSRRMDMRLMSFVFFEQLDSESGSYGR